MSLSSPIFAMVCTSESWQAALASLGCLVDQCSLAPELDKACGLSSPGQEGLQLGLLPLTFYLEPRRQSSQLPVSNPCSQLTF